MIVHITLDGRKDQIEKLEDFKVRVNIEMPELEVIRDLVEEIHMALAWTKAGMADKIYLDAFDRLQDKLEELVPRRKSEASE